MKNQYFGDNKDLFTYDLAYWILRAGLAGRLTFVPMLTAPDGSNDGGKTDRSRARAGTQHRELVDFLDKCVREGRRDIRELDKFFSGHELEMTIYSNDEKYFTHRNRGKYFEGIGDDLLTDSLILTTPDNGLEVAHSGERHLLFEEARALYDRMDEKSILMLAQHFPRHEHESYLHRRAEQVMVNVSGEAPVTTDDNELIFFFLTKDEELEHDLAELLYHYTQEYS